MAPGGGLAARLASEGVGLFNAGRERFMDNVSLWSFLLIAVAALFLRHVPILHRSLNLRHERLRIRPLTVEGSASFPPVEYFTGLRSEAFMPVLAFRPCAGLRYTVDDRLEFAIAASKFGHPHP